MPRLYLTPLELEESPLGMSPQILGQIQRLPAGALDRLLMRASQRVDSYCEKRIQSPQTTTLLTTANAGDTSISIVSTNGFDNLAEQAVIIDTGSVQETVEILSGGVSVTTYVTPYPGVLTLATPLQFGHSAGAPIVGCYKEVREAITASQGDPYSEALQTQAAQLALAHLPAMHVGLTRIAFTKSYPIQNVFEVEHSYSFDTQYNLIYNNSNPTFTGNIIVEPTAGYIRFRVGSVITPQGFLRITYTAGFQVIPEDIKNAVSYYLAEDMKMYLNPFYVQSERQGKLSRSWSANHTGIEEAERILKKYRRSV